MLYPSLGSRSPLFLSGVSVAVRFAVFLFVGFCLCLLSLFLLCLLFLGLLLRLLCLVSVGVLLLVLFCCGLLVLLCPCLVVLVVLPLRLCLVLLAFSVLRLCLVSLFVLVFVWVGLALVGSVLLALFFLLLLSLCLLLRSLAGLLSGLLLVRSLLCPASFWRWGSCFFLGALPCPCRCGFTVFSWSLPMSVSNPAAKEMYLARRAELHSRIEELLVLQEELRNGKQELVKLNDILDIDEDPFVDMEDHYNN